MKWPWTGFSWLYTGKMVGCCEYSDLCLGFIEYREFVD